MGWGGSKVAGAPSKPRSSIISNCPSKETTLEYSHRS